MPVSIAIVGASGVVGSALAGQLLRSQMMKPFDRLQLVGHGASADKLLGTRIDLLDAFDDYRIDVETVPNLEDVDADIVVITSSTPMAPGIMNRRDLGIYNVKIFEEIARKCTASSPNAFYILISNPIELAIEILCRYIDRKRVIGMGAEQDSLRFARAIAKNLDVHRDRVRATVLGEHGPAMVPLWSSVEIDDADPSLLNALEELKQKSRAKPLSQRAAELQSEVVRLLKEDDVTEAYEITRRSLPDARILAQPFITLHCMHSTPNATANATLSCLTPLLTRNHHKVHGQVLLQGEFLGINGACGIPLQLDHEQWQVGPIGNLDESERVATLEAANSIRAFSAEAIAKAHSAEQIPSPQAH